MRSFTTKGNVVVAYIGSPSRAFLVEIACASARGIFVPAGMTARFGSAGCAGLTDTSFAGEATFVDAGAAGCAEVSVGLTASGACAQAIAETSSSVHTPRIAHLPKQNSSAISVFRASLLRLSR